MDNLEIALLKIIRALVGPASTQSIYGELEEGDYFKLTEEHLKKQFMVTVQLINIK